MNEIGFQLSIHLHSLQYRDSSLSQNMQQREHVKVIVWVGIKVAQINLLLRSTPQASAYGEWGHWAQVSRYTPCG